MHFRYDWPDQNVSRETLVKFYAIQHSETKGNSWFRTAALLALLALAAPLLESTLF